MMMLMAFECNEMVVMEVVVTVVVVAFFGSCCIYWRRRWWWWRNRRRREQQDAAANGEAVRMPGGGCCTLWMLLLLQMPLLSCHRKNWIYIYCDTSTSSTNSLLQTTSDNIVFDGLGFESCLESQKVNNSRIQRTVCFV